MDIKCTLARIKSRRTKTDLQIFIAIILQLSRQILGGRTKFIQLILRFSHSLFRHHQSLLLLDELLLVACVWKVICIYILNHERVRATFIVFFFFYAEIHPRNFPFPLPRASIALESLSSLSLLVLSPLLHRANPASFSPRQFSCTIPRTACLYNLLAAERIVRAGRVIVAERRCWYPLVTDIL